MAPWSEDWPARRKTFKRPMPPEAAVGDRADGPRIYGRFLRASEVNRRDLSRLPGWAREVTALDAHRLAGDARPVLASVSLVAEGRNRLPRCGSLSPVGANAVV